MFDKPKLTRDVDWLTIILYLSLVIFGWFSIYEAMYDVETQAGIFETQKSFKQFIWIVTALGIGAFILLLDIRFFSAFAYPVYGFMLLMLVAVLIVGKEVGGARAWFDLGFFRIQPAEFAKFATALALARYLSKDRLLLNRLPAMLGAAAVLGLPAVLILLENETGSTLVFGAFAIVLYREGLPQFFMVAGLTVVGFLVASLLMLDSLQHLMANLIYTGGGVVVLLFLMDYLGQKKDKRPPFTTLLLQLGLGIAFVTVPLWLPSTELQSLVSAKEAFIRVPVFKTYLFILIGIFGLSSLVLGVLAFYKPQYQKVALAVVFTGVSLGVVTGLDVFLKEGLQPYQQKRLQVLVNPDLDPKGAGYQVGHSKIAISSGGLWGQGYLQGTLTKLNYVPDQSTDFIFCTVGEERGWVGSLAVIALFVGLLLRLVHLAERQKSRFSRVYGYSVASIIFFHFMVNMGMTIGAFPVIGIPLPFFSYGGSSLWSFTILLFIMLKLDVYRKQQVVIHH